MRVQTKTRGSGLDLFIGLVVLITAVWAVSPQPAHGEPELPPRATRPIACADASPRAGGAVELVTLDHAPVPPITASSAAVIDAATGRVLYGHQMHERRAPASTTKIMTALLSVEAISDQNAWITSSTDASLMVDSSVMGLFPAAEVTLRDLLYGLMLPSGNDAAIELARNLAPSEQAFIDVMNERAARMGLQDTHFANPHGLDAPDHYSSAYDMAVIARFAMQNPSFREIAATPVYHLSPPFDYDVQNGNSLLGAYPGAEGVKIGWTEAAGWTFVASANRDGRSVIVSIMNSADRDADATALLDWAYTSPYWQGAEWTPPPPTRIVHRPANVAGFRLGISACASAPAPAASGGD